MPVFVGTGSDDFEAKSDRVGVPIETSDPNPASVGDMYFNNPSGKLRVYDGTSWDDVGASDISGNVSGGTPYTPAAGDGIYKFNVFTNPGTLTVSNSDVVVEAIIVGGGGGGACSTAGWGDCLVEGLGGGKVSPFNLAFGCEDFLESVLTGLGSSSFFSCFGFEGTFLFSFLGFWGVAIFSALGLRLLSLTSFFSTGSKLVDSKFGSGEGVEMGFVSMMVASLFAGSGGRIRLPVRRS